MSILQVSNLTKFYGKILGVQDVTFSVEQGEIFGFLGSNGAGKTTTIRLMMSLLYPDEGDISFFGIPLKNNQVQLKQRIGYLPGEFSPYREMSGQGFLKYMAKYRSRPPMLRDSVVNQLQLTPNDLSQKIKYLSHGTRQKLGIVFALEHDPDIAILDEPTSGLDPLIQESFYQILLNFQQRGKTVFLSSHILPEVEKICHRVAIIRQGKIVALESIEKLKHKRPRRLIIELENKAKENPLNLPKLRLLEHSENRYVYLVEGEIPSLLNKLRELPIKDIIFPEPDLEDIFLAYYAEDE